MNSTHPGNSSCRRLLLGALAALSTCLTLSAQAPTPAPLPDISGFWELSFDGRHVPPARLQPAVTPAMLRAQAEKDAYARRWCHFLGMPAAMDSPRPIDIRQGRREVLINFEWRATPRHIYLERKSHDLAADFDATTMGDSIGHWEGDTLVVDTVAFDGSRGQTMIPGGGFRTSQSRLVERYRLSPSGTSLLVTFTWHDPKVFRTPHTYAYRYVRAPRFYEVQPPMECDPFDQERTDFLLKPPSAVTTR